MALIDGLGKPATYEVDSDADIGSGPLTSLSGAEGFWAGSLGFDSANFNQNFNKMTLICSKASGRTFLVLKGSVGYCAVVISPASGAAGIVYLVAPAALGIPGSYPSLSAAVAAAPPGTKASFAVLAANYVETSTIQLWHGINVFGIGNINDGDANVDSAVTIASTATPAFQWSGNPGFVSFTNVRLARVGAGTIIDIPVGLGGISALSFDRVAFSATVPGVAAILCNSSIAITLLDSFCDNRSTITVSTAAGGGRFHAAGCRFQGYVSVDDFVRFSDCRFEDGFLCGQGRVEECYATTIAGAQPVVTFLPKGAGEQLLLKNVLLAGVGAGAGISLVAFAGVAGTIIDDGLEATQDTDPGYSWVQSNHNVVSNTFARSRLSAQYPAQAVNFDVSKLADIIEVTPTALITATLPVASTDLPGRRVLVRNLSATQGFYLRGDGGEPIDNQTSAEPPYLPPLGVMEVECDRANASWRRVQPRNAGDVYVVAKDGSGIPNSYPSFAAAQAVIDKDKTARTFVPVVVYYPGTYVEDIFCVYGITLRGASEDPTAVVLQGNHSITADANAVGVVNVSVKGSLLLSEGGGGAITMANCIVDSLGLVPPSGNALSIAGGTFSSLTRVYDCVVRHNLGTVGIFVNTSQRVDMHDCITEGTQRASLVVQGTDTATIEDCDFGGGVSFVSGVFVYFRRNVVGVDSVTRVGVAMGQNHFVENIVFRPTLPTDYVISNAGAPSGTLRDYRALSASAGIFPGSPPPEAMWGLSANRLELYGGASTVARDKPIHIASGAGGYALDLFNKFSFPQGSLLFFVNVTAGVVTLTTSDGTLFQPGGLAAYPIPANSAIILIVDAIGNNYYVASAL